MDQKTDSGSVRCWKETGVFGDGACPRLIHLAHCRHCDIYTSAGRRRLDRDIPPGVREEWTTIMGREKEAAKLGSISVIVFRLKDELLALKTIFFQEASDLGVPHVIPGRVNKILKGIVNINGELLVCLSMSDLLGLTSNDKPFLEEGDREKPASGTIYPRLIVFSKEGKRFVFPVDEVLGIHRISDEDIQELPATLSKSARALTTGLFSLREQTVGLLDEEKLYQSMTRSLAV